MNVRVMGYVDQVIEVDKEKYEAALAAGALSQYMDPLIANISIDLTYGKEEEFNGDFV